MTYTCTAPRTGSISWLNLPGITQVDYYPRSQIGQQVIGDFQIALISNIPSGFGLADLTITLTVTATQARNGTVVECGGDDPSERVSQVLYIASELSVQSVNLEYVCNSVYMCTQLIHTMSLVIRESVDSLCRDGANAQYMQYLSKSHITSQIR